MNMDSTGSGSSGRISPSLQGSGIDLKYGKNISAIDSLVGKISEVLTSHSEESPISLGKHDFVQKHEAMVTCMKALKERVYSEGSSLEDISDAAKEARSAAEELRINLGSLDDGTVKQSIEEDLKNLEEQCLNLTLKTSLIRFEEELKKYAQSTSRKPPASSSVVSANLEQYSTERFHNILMQGHTSNPMRCLERNLGHILGDFFIKEDYRFEGNTSSQTLSMMEALLSTFKSGTDKEKASIRAMSHSEQVVEDIKHCQKISDLVDRGRSKTKTEDLYPLIDQALSAVSKNISLYKRSLIPGGFPKHAMLYEAIEDDGGKYSLKVYNTGAGLQYHTHKIFAGKKKYETCLKYDYDNKEACLRDIKTLLTIVMTSEALQSKKYSAADIYDGVLRARHFTVPSQGNDDMMMIPQRAGTCSWYCLVAMMRPQFKEKKSYQQWKCLMRLRVLREAYNLLNNRSDASMEAVKFVRKGAEKLSNYVYKLWNSDDAHSVLSYDDAVEALQTIKTIMAWASEKERVELVGSDPSVFKGPVTEEKGLWQKNIENIKAYFSRYVKFRAENPPIIDTLPPDLSINVTSASAEETLREAVGYCSFLKKNGNAQEAAIFARQRLITLPPPAHGDKDSLWKQVENPMACMRQIEKLSQWCISPSMQMKDQPLASYMAYAIADKLAVTHEERTGTPEQYRISQHTLYCEPLNELYTDKLCSYSSQETTSLSGLLKYFAERNDGLIGGKQAMFRPRIGYGIAFLRTEEASYMSTFLRGEKNITNDAKLQLGVAQLFQKMREGDDFKISVRFQDGNYDSFQTDQVCFYKELPEEFRILREIALRSSVSASVKDAASADAICYKASAQYKPSVSKEIIEERGRVPAYEFLDLDETYVTVEYFYDDRLLLDKTNPSFESPLIQKYRECGDQLPQKQSSIKTALLSRREEGEILQQEITPLERALSFVRSQEVLQISNLIEYFESSPNKFEDEDFRLFFELILFEKGFLTTRLKEEPDIARQLLNFMLKAKDRYSAMDNTKELLFCIHIIQRLNEYVIDAFPEDTAKGEDIRHLYDHTIFHSEDSIVNFLRKRRDDIQDPKEKNAIWQQLIMMYSRCDILDEQMMSDTLVGVAHIKDYGVAEKYRDSHIEHEMKTALLHITSRIEDDKLSDNMVLNIFRQCLPSQLPQSDEKDRFTIEKKLPFIIVEDKTTGTSYHYNALNGIIYVDGVAILNNHSRFVGDPMYKKLFGDKKLHGVSEQQADFFTYCNYDSSLYGPLEIYAREKGIVCIRRSIGSEKYSLLTAIQVGSLPLPIPLRSQQYLHWVNESTGNIIICDKAMKTVYTIDDDALKHAEDPSLSLTNLFTDSEKLSQKRFSSICSFFDPEEADKIYPRYRFETSQCTLVWKKDDSPNIIEFPRYVDKKSSRLSFSLKDERWHASFDESYFLADSDNDERLKTLLRKNTLLAKGLDRYLIVTDGKGSYKAIMPRQKGSDANLDADATYDYIIADIDDNGNFKVSSKIDALFMAYQHLYHRDYLSVLRYLRQAEKNTVYSPEELGVCLWILSSLEENKDHDPEAASLRIYASHTIFQNVRKLSKKEKASSKYKDFVTYWNKTFTTLSSKKIPIKTPDQPYGNFWGDLRQNLQAYYISARNVDMALDFRDLLDQETRLSFFSIMIKPTEEQKIASDSDKKLSFACIARNEKTKKEYPLLDEVGDETIIREILSAYDAVHTIDGFQDVPRKGKSPLFIEDSLPSPEYPPFLYDVLETWDLYYSSYEGSVEKMFEEHPPHFWLRPGKEFLEMFKVLYQTIKNGETQHFPSIRHIINLMTNETDQETAPGSDEYKNRQLCKILYNTMLLVEKKQASRLPKWRELEDFIGTSHISEDSKDYFWETLEQETDGLLGFPPRVIPKGLTESTSKGSTSYFSLLKTGIQNIHSFTPSPREIRPPSQKSGHTIVAHQEEEIETLLTENYTALLARTIFHKKPVAVQHIDEIGHYSDDQRSRLGETVPTAAFAESRFSLLNVDFKYGLSENAAVNAQYTTIEGVAYHDIKRSLVDRSLHFDSIASEKEQAIYALANKELPKQEGQTKKDLKISGKKQEPISIEQCMAAYLHDDDGAFISRNIALDTADVVALRKMITTYLLAKTQQQQIQRSTKLLDAIIACGEESSPKRSLLINRLAMTMNATRAYDYHSHHDFLVMEYQSDILIWPSQAEKLKEIFAKSDNGVKEKVFQILMGGGKSKVMGILASLEHADGEHLSMYMVPKSLYETTIEDMKAISERSFGQKTHGIQFNREPEACTVENFKAIHDTLIKAIERREYIITTGETIQCLELELYTELHNYSRLDYDARFDRYDQTIQQAIKHKKVYLEQKIRWLTEILNIIKTRSIATIDEIDSVLDCRHEVNFTIGKKDGSFDSEKIDLFGELFSLLTTSTVEIDFKGEKHSIKDLVGLVRNEQSHLTKESYDQIKHILAEHLIEYFIKSLSPKRDADVFSDNLQQALVLNRDELVRYLSGDSLATPEFLQDLSRGFLKSVFLAERSESTSALAFAELIALSRHLLNENLYSVLSNKVDEHFGLSKSSPDNLYAIPYVAKDVPHEGSQFSDNWETASKTFITYINKGLERHHVASFVEMAYNEYSILASSEEELDQKNALELCKCFEEAFGHDLKCLSWERLTPEYRQQLEEDLCGTIHEALSRGEIIPLFLDFIKKALSSYEYHSEQLNSSAMDLRAILPKIYGYSGTANVKESDRDKNLGRVTAMLSEEDNRMITLCDAVDTKDILEKTFSASKHPEEIHAFIDIGAQFKGQTNAEIARDMLSFVHGENPDIQGVIYFNAANKLTVIKLGEEEHPIEIGESDATTIMKKSGLRPEQLFTYYDQVHITGTDIKQALPSRAIVSFSETTVLRDLLQGIMRMREFTAGIQHVDFVMTKKIADTMRRILGLPESQSISVDDIVTYAELKAITRRTEDSFREKAQEMDSIIKHHIFAKLIDTKLSFKDRLGIFDKFDYEIFIHRTGRCQYDMHHSHSIMTDTATVLKAMKDKKLKSVREKIEFIQRSDDSALSPLFTDTIENIERDLDAALARKPHDKATPAEVKNPASLQSEGQSVEVEQQVSVEKETEKEIEQESCSPAEERGIKTESPWDINLSTVSKLSDIVSHETMRSVRSLDKTLPKRFSSDIYATDNFLSVFDGDTPSLYERPSYHLLALKTQDSNKWSFIYVSQKESVAIAEQLIIQAQEDKDPKIQSWLLMPDGSIIQSGKHSLSEAVADESSAEAFNIGMAQTLFARTHFALRNKKYAHEFFNWMRSGTSHRKSSFKKVIKNINTYREQHLGLVPAEHSLILGKSDVIRTIASEQASPKTFEGDFTEQTDEKPTELRIHDLTNKQLFLLKDPALINALPLKKLRYINPKNYDKIEGVHKKAWYSINRVAKGVLGAPAKVARLGASGVIGAASGVVGAASALKTKVVKVLK
ncbi:MAG: DUF3638 domain-containing protein [Waddliaceae bacterium]|jgi:hypothetical protein|nr:DUF3638 domain-containing protein [Waddliaceae bacterium]